MAQGLGLGLHLTSNTPELDILGSLEQPQKIDILQFNEGYPYVHHKETLAIYFWRREGHLWGNPELRECVTYEIMKKCLERSYTWEYRDLANFLQDLQETIEADLFDQDNCLHPDLQFPIRRLRIQCHHSSSLEEANNKLFLRRQFYIEGLYHSTLIFQMKPDDENHFIAVEILARRSNDDYLPHGLDSEECHSCP